MSVMHTMTENEKAVYKAQKINEARTYHAEIIKDLGINETDFNVKAQFRDKYGRLVVGIYPSEFKKVKGFFFELVDFDLNPINYNDRKVYRIAPSKSYDEEYEIGTVGAYLVPIEELKVVNPQSVAINKESAFIDDKNIFKVTQKAQQTAMPKVSEINVIKDDAPYTEMTIRDYIAIHKGQPVSNKEWLNQLIKQLP